MANHDTALGARNGVGIIGPSLGLTIAGVLSHVPLALAFHYNTWNMPDDFARNLEAVASMFNATVRGGHGHCVYIGHWPLVDFTLAHWTVAMG